MGGVCCGSRIRSVLADQDGFRNHPISPLKIEDVVAQGISIMVLGPKGVGKTLLFLRLTYPQVEVSDVTNITAETATLHVELFSRGGMAVLLWDVSSSGVAGDIALSQISGNLQEYGATNILQSLHISGIIYIVSLIDSTPQTISMHRQAIARLTTDAAAPVRKMLVVLNTFGAFDTDSEERRFMENKLVRGLILAKTQSWLGEKRFSWVVTDVRQGLDSPELASAFDKLLNGLLG